VDAGERVLRTGSSKRDEDGSKGTIRTPTVASGAQSLAVKEF